MRQKKLALLYKKKLFYNKNLELSSLESKLNILKRDFSDNLTQIKRTEEQISKIVEQDLQNKLRDWKIFECLGAEKPTPAFVNIAKKRQIRIL